MKVQLKIKELPGKRYSTAGLTLKPEHLPASALKEERKKVLPGEIFEVPSKEEAQIYMRTGHVEVVL